MKKNTQKGFTLVELLVVIAILAILASVAVVGYTAFIEKADTAKAEAELKQLITLIDAEYAEEGEVDLALLQEFIEDNKPEGSTVTVAADDDGVITLTYSTGKGEDTGTLMVKAVVEEETPANPEG